MLNAARSYYEALKNLVYDKVIAKTQGIILLTSDEEGKISSDETDRGLTGKIVASSVRKGFKG